MKLNKTERIKQELPPYKFNLKEVDFFNLTEKDRFYLKNYGIYNSKLRSNEFFIRVRVKAGKLSKSQIIFIANLAKEYNLELILTARAQIDLHKILPQDILKIYESLVFNNITSHQTLTDNFRNIVTSVFDGKTSDNKIYCYLIISELDRFIVDNPKFFGMIPRKFNTAICGDIKSSFSYFGNDLYFGLAKKDNILGFNVYVGGKNNQVAKDLDIFVTKDEVVEVFKIVANIYLKYGLRESRARARLFYLIEEIGLKKFRDLIAKEFNNIKSKGEYLVKKESFMLEKEGVRCYETKYGLIKPNTLLKIAQKSKEVWFGIDQNIYYIGRKIDSFNLASVNITACAGSRYCFLSLWDIKEDTAYLPLDLIKKYNISVGFSGCLKGCGRHYFVDIGIIGLRTNTFGKTARSARVFIGGVYTKEDAKLARLISYAIPLEHLKSFISLIINEFLRYEYRDFEDFSYYILSRYSEGFLMVWFLSKIYLKHNLKLDKEEELLFKKLQALLNFPLIEPGQNYIKIVNYLKHKIWDYEK